MFAPRSNSPIIPDVPPPSACTTPSSLSIRSRSSSSRLAPPATIPTYLELPLLVGPSDDPFILSQIRRAQELLASAQGASQTYASRDKHRFRSDGTNEYGYVSDDDDVAPNMVATTHPPGTKQHAHAADSNSSHHAVASLPREIRLQRSSHQEKHAHFIKANPRHDVLQFSDRLARKDSLMHKSCVADAALTRTFVHIFLPQSHNETLRGDGLDRKPRTTSATLQVVRAPHSIYEVIWIDQIATAYSTWSGSSTTSDETIAGNVDERENLPNETDFEELKTTLAAWSWEGNMSNMKETTSKRPRSLARSTKAQRMFDAEVSGEHMDDHERPASILTSLALGEVASDHTARIEAQESSLSRRISSTGTQSYYTKDPSGQRSTLSANDRQRLLGNRKLSGLPDEEDHFKTHKDSLILAHQRIFRDGKSHVNDYEGAVELRINDIRRASWTKPHSGPSSQPQVTVLTD